MNDESFKNKAPELLQDMASQVQAVLVEYGEINPSIASGLGQEAAERIAQAWGGNLVYVPKGDSIRGDRRAQKIWENFNGRNAQELARQHGISIVWAYKIIKRKRDEEINRRQGVLFTSDDAEK